MTGAAPTQPALACGGNQVGILGKGHYCVGCAGEPPRAPSQTASPFPHGIAVALSPCEPRGVRFPFECKKQARYPFADERAFLSLVPISNCRRGTDKPRKGKTMSDQMSRRGFMGAAATGAVALAGFALAGCSSTSASPEKSSEKEKTVKPVILVTSFGTSYNDSRHITIGAIEDAIREKYWQDYDIRRAFTAQIIIDKLKKRDGITIDNMTEALDRCVEDGVKEIVVQPTHLMAGLEYADVKDELDKYADKFDKISLGDPLLTSDDDYKKVAAAIKENMASFDDGKTALCLMGHGTEADSNADYAKMQEVFKNEGLTQFFVGTVEAEPTCEVVIAAASAAGYKKAVLAPFMVVAGDHANNDMADETDPDSWAAKFVAAGFEVTCLLQGLGQNAAVDDIYVSHVDDAIAKL